MHIACLHKSFKSSASPPFTPPPEQAHCELSRLLKKYSKFNKSQAHLTVFVAYLPHNFESSHVFLKKKKKVMARHSQ